MIDLLDELSVISTTLRQVLDLLIHQLALLDNSIDRYKEQIKKQASDNDVCQRLQSILGIGPLVTLMR